MLRHRLGITQDVPPDALAFGRARQVNKEGQAKRQPEEPVERSK